jgi:hypothetical protein
MTKQTSVEWLEFEINRRGPKENNPPQWLKELYEQAKEMEYERMLEFANWCRIYDKSHPNEVNMIQQLYTKFKNETYGGEK